MSTEQFPPPRMFLVGHVAVGSRNRVKIAAVASVVRHYWPQARVEGLEVPSGVDDQPFGDEATIRGARARAAVVLEAAGSDLGVGLEGGVVRLEAGGLRTCAWAAVATRDGRSFLGGSLAMPLPPRVALLVEGGMELGHAMDAITGVTDTKHGAGAVGVLTNGLVDRQRAYETLVTYALAPLVRADLWDLVPARRA